MVKVGEIVVGRNPIDLEKHGTDGTIFLGKKGVMRILLDIARPHVMLVTGKRGYGKSYSASVIAEGIQMLPEKLRKKLSVLMVDTMGIFWSMKYPNTVQEELLKEWGYEPKSFSPKVFIPEGLKEEFKRKRVPYDIPYTFKPRDISAQDWALTFGTSLISPIGILLERVVRKLQDEGIDYTMDDLMARAEQDESFPRTVRQALVNRFLAAKGWGIFSKEGIELSKLIRGGQVSILDVSPYPWGVKCLILSLLARKILRERLITRRIEEMERITEHVFEEKKGIPMVWMLVDEIHQFIPRDKVTPATDALIRYIREGREPGLSIAMLTQRPGALHETALSQCDLILCHRITARADVEALNKIMQTYLPLKIQKYLDELPKKPGPAILLDDTKETLLSLTVRPRLSHHAGGTPSILD